ncbi:hypothetical protein SDJN02_18506 [Cucurbita argyrosperma subsp. argyrosperma]|nr:hypothetical protein SDJN02_18506 [Cucurbita argyrosperma subsp. argyrosperma]
MCCLLQAQVRSAHGVSSTLLEFTKRRIMPPRGNEATGPLSIVMYVCNTLDLISSNQFQFQFPYLHLPPFSLPDI